MFTLDLGLIAAISVSQFFVTEGWMLLVARLFLGACVAADYPMASSLLTEFSPRKYRGQFLSGLVCMFFIGAAAAYFVGDAMLRHLGDDGWRWFLASAAVPALTLLLLRLGTPESPRWLLSRGRGSEAQQVLTRVYGAHVTVADIAQDAGPTSTWRDLLRRGYLGRLVYVVIFYTCSNIPVFAIYTFGPEILGAFGLESISDNIGSAVLEFLFLIGGVVTALLVINKTGRRRMVIWGGSILAGLALLVLGLAPEASPPLVVVTAFTSFAIFNGGPPGPDMGLPPQRTVSHCHPCDRSGYRDGIDTRRLSSRRLSRPPLSLEHLGIGGTMLIAAAILIFGGVVSIIWAPETTGLSLDEASSIDNGAGGHRPAAQTGQSPLAAKSDRY